MFQKTKNSLIFTKDIPNLLFPETGIGDFLFAQERRKVTEMRLSETIVLFFIPFQTNNKTPDIYANQGIRNTYFLQRKVKGAYAGQHFDGRH